MDAYEKQFDMRQETPAYWHNKSGDLFVSARTLWKAMQEKSELEINCGATYKMLMGMSFELLFKAHCIGANISFPSSHNLAALARAANFITSNDENEIFDVLSEYVIWDGRYPIPKKPQHLETHWKRESKVTNDSAKLGDLTMLVSNGKLDYENLLLIWRKYSDIFLERYN